MTSPPANRRASAAERRSSRLIRRDQPGRPGHPHCFKPTVDVQFGEDITYVGSHGVGRDHQILGYLPPSLALHHAQQHLSFPGGNQDLPCMTPRMTLSSSAAAWSLATQADTPARAASTAWATARSELRTTT